MAFTADTKNRLTLALASPAAADEMESTIAAEISDTAYNASTWDNVTTIGASKNALRDKFVLVDAANALKAPAASPTFTGSVVFSDQTLSTAATFDASKRLVSSATTSTELGYVHGVTSDIQAQLNARLTATRAANVTALTGLTGTPADAMLAVADIALSTSDTYSDAAVNAAVNTAIHAANQNILDLFTKMNAEIAALKASNVQSSS